MKKRFIFFAALAVFLAIAVTPANAAKPLKIVKGPYLQKLTPDSIVIMWETNTAADSRVDFGLEAPSPYYVEDSTPVKIHEIQLTGLAADTMYYYTVTSDGVTSAESTFWTAPDTERSFRFVAYGDTRTYPTDHAAVIQGIINTPGAPPETVLPPEIVICTGDLVENGDNYGQWGRQFFDPAHDLMINTPLLPIIGNHEGNGNLFRDFFSLGDNDLGDNDDWFAFSYSNVRFIGLNTHNASGGYSLGSTQYKWLEAELQSPECTSADWQIVYFHHPPYSSGSHGGDTGVQTHLVPLFEAHGVDMVFSGHDHFYESSFKEGVHYVVTGGGGAPLRATGVNPNPYQIYAESTLHHCVIDVDVAGETLTLSARYNDGYEFDTITLYNVDVTPPTASLLVPLDNGADDLDADNGEVTVNSTQPVFDIQLSDVGDGIKDGTVISAAVVLTKGEGDDKVLLTEPDDYSFGYNETLDVITLTPAGGEFGNGLYVITLSGIADMAGNPMAPTSLSVVIDTSIVPPQEISFQQGVNGYSGMVDTMIRAATPDQNYDDSATEHYGGYQYQYNADTESGGTGKPCQVLLRFDGIIGDGPGQIPAGSAIVSATLRIRSTDDGNGGKLHRILQSWDDTVVTWNNSFGGNGIDADGISEAASLEDDGVPSNSPDTDVDLGVTATLQDWADGAAVNNGWAILPNGTNGWHMAAAEHPTLGYRPELIVTFVVTEDEPPVAVDDAYSVDEDNTLTVVAASGVLDNDTDPDPEDTLTAVLDSDVSNGTLTLNSDGSFTYTPNANFNGTDSFTYRANDGILNSNVATVTITVNAVEDAPVANDDSYSTTQDTTLSVAAPGVLGNDTDADNDPLTAVLVSNVSNGTLTLYTDGSFDYTPTGVAPYADSFTYRVNDKIWNSNEATVTITVNSVAGDVVTITKAEYVIGKSELKVEATSSEGGTALLTVVGYGTMTYYDSRKNIHKFRDKPVLDPGGTVTVTSSLGGSATASVNHK